MCLEIYVDREACYLVSDRGVTVPSRTETHASEPVKEAIIREQRICDVLQGRPFQQFC